MVPGTHEGAPAGVPWRKKLIWTTAITALIWAMLAYIIFGGMITRADISKPGSADPLTIW